MKSLPGFDHFSDCVCICLGRYCGITYCGIFSGKNVWVALDVRPHR
jgi:hypothetical protein